MQHYHYIFTGSGLSALMTVYEMIQSGKFEDKEMLLIDANSKKTNDRTWCFWDDGNLFEPIVSKKWSAAFFTAKDFTRKLDLQPYHYKMIHGVDFYKLVFDAISRHRNIHFLNEKVTDFRELGNHCIVKTENKSFTCNKIFNSVYQSEWAQNQTRYPLLQQHFIGWFVKSSEPVFDSETATFMDFSVEQKGNTRFMYVLPVSPTEALVEYTLFSKELLLEAEYETEIRNYIKKLGITAYEIIAKEQGNIPMTAYKFWKNNTPNILHIGSAGGWTKASTGYTFKNTVKNSKALAAFLQTEGDLGKFHKRNRFWWYDLLFLDVLARRNELGANVFSALFRKGNPALVFKLLDEKTTLAEDLKVIAKCPKGLFLKALLLRIAGLR